MGYNVSSLPAYVQENRLPLIHKAVLGAKTAKLINRMSGVKGKAALNLISTNPAIKAAACSFNAEGDATLSQRILETQAAQVQMSFCEKDLIGKWAEYQVRIAAGEKELPFEAEIMDSVAGNIAEAVEIAIWQGDSLGNDGLEATIKADGGVEATVAEGASVFEAIKSVYMTIHPAILKKAVIFVGEDTYRAFVMDLMEKNLYHYASEDVEETYFPGTKTKVVAVPGLVGTNTIVAADPDNLFYGYDVADAENIFDVWYSKDNQEFRLNVEFNYGMQVAYPDEVVYATL